MLLLVASIPVIVVAAAFPWLCAARRAGMSDVRRPSSGATTSAPYAFVAKAWAYALEADHDPTLDWRPYARHRLVPGTRSSSAIRTLGDGCAGAYMDARRFANNRG